MKAVRGKGVEKRRAEAREERGWRYKQFGDVLPRGKECEGSWRKGVGLKKG